MGKVKAKAKKKTRNHPLVHRGVIIQRPAHRPSVPLAQLRRAAKLAVERHAHDLQAAE
jgi:hypothetical protein